MFQSRTVLGKNEYRCSCLFTKNTNIDCDANVCTYRQVYVNSGARRAEDTSDNGASEDGDRVTPARTRQGNAQ